MKRFFYTIILFTFILSACGGKQTTGDSIEQIMDQYPEVSKALKDLSEDDLERVLVPQYIPFHVEDVEAVVYPGESMQVELIFSNGSMNLHVMTMEGGHTSIPNHEKLAQLESGYDAHYNTNEFGKVLQWSDQEHEGFYTLKLMTYTPELEIPYTKHDLLEVANSFYSEQATS